MDDINNMTLNDFYGILAYLEYENKLKTKQPVPLTDSQKEMIKITKEKEEVDKNG